MISLGMLDEVSMTHQLEPCSDKLVELGREDLHRPRSLAKLQYRKIGVDKTEVECKERVDDSPDSLALLLLTKWKPLLNNAQGCQG